MSYFDGVHNARIIETFLGFEDHGMFVLCLTLDYGGQQQAFQRVIGVDANLRAILSELLETVQADCWENLKGKYVRAKVDGDFVRQIGHLLFDRWTTDPRQEVE